MNIIIILVILILIFIIVRPYLIKYDTVIAFTGGLGSGKSVLSVQYSIKLLKINTTKVFIYNNIKRYLYKLFHLKQPLKPRFEKPLLYSSIPINYRLHLWSKKQYSIELTHEHLLLSKKILPKSIIFIDEIGSFANQFQFKNPNILDNFNEFVRLFRHYTLGGYLIVNDQCSENIVLEIRRRINTVYNLMHFKKWFFFFYSVKIRDISISEEIKTIEENNTEDNMRTYIGILPSKKTFDTYCYSNKYITVPSLQENQYFKLKKNKLLSIDGLNKIIKKTTSDE